MGIFGKLFKRSYDAATPQRARFNGGANRYATHAAETSAARGTLQSRARHAVENQPIAHAIIDTWETSAVGAGIYPTSQHPDSEIRAALDAYFATWARRADLVGRTDFYGIQAAAVRAERTDGEAFFLWHGDQLQQVPAEQIAMDLSTDLGGGRMIVNGVELDHVGRPVALHIHPARPSDLFATYAPPVRVPIEDCLHVFKPAGPGAVRGLSSLASVLLRLSELDGLEDALQVNVKVSALLSVILTNESDPGDGTDPLSDGQGLAPGAIVKLPGGWKASTTAPQQAQQVGDFLKHVTQSIAVGAGVPHFAATGDVSQANYSSLRAALVTFRQRVEQYQFHTLAPQLLDPVWRRIAAAAVLSGAVDAAIDDDLFSVEWIPPAQPWVDPMKDAQAQILLMDNGLSSRRQVVAGLGYSIEKLDAEIAADREREAALGHNTSEKSNAADS
ncbi:MAG: phage portal protein [Kaistia sp. SCN 65-12]|nr:MAG: phage portal protein [Kaistia sp. SCN 65-12]